MRLVVVLGNFHNIHDSVATGWLEREGEQEAAQACGCVFKQG